MSRRTGRHIKYPRQKTSILPFLRTLFYLEKKNQITHYDHTTIIFLKIKDKKLF